MTAAALVVASGLALAASLPSLDWAPLAWVGLVPLLWATSERGLPAAFAWGWLGGLVFYVATTYWIVHTVSHYTTLPMPVAVALLVLMASVLACYTGAFTAGVAWARRHALPWPILAPALWVSLEWLRGWFFIGFPWGALGYSQHRFSDLVQVAEVTGVYGVSAVLVLFNAIVADVLRPGSSRVRPRLTALLALTVMMVALPLAGRVRRAGLERLPAAGRLVVGIAQGNVDQARKWDPAFQDETMARYARLTRQAAARGAQLVVWPETATPFFFQDPGPRRDAVLDLARETGAELVFGSPGYERRIDGSFAQTNRVYRVDGAGWERELYDKMQLVPFGEYVPFSSVLFFVDEIVTAVGAIVPGRHATIFDGPARTRFGALVCYEGIFPALSRRLVAGGANLLVNVTNDAWYGRTSAPWQHLVQATFRTIENRVPMVRAANTGISAIIGADGRMRWHGPLEQELWHVEEIEWPAVRTFYTRFGDVFVWLCIAITLAAAAIAVRRRRRLGPRLPESHA